MDLYETHSKVSNRSRTFLKKVFFLINLSLNFLFKIQKTCKLKKQNTQEIELQFSSCFRLYIGTNHLKFFVLYQLFEKRLRILCENILLHIDV